MSAWVLDPHSGGVKIPEAVKQRIEVRIKAFADSHYKDKFVRLGIRFRGALCYIDAYTEPELPSKSLLKATGETLDQFLERMRNEPLHLC